MSLSILIPFAAPINQLKQAHSDCNDDLLLLQCVNELIERIKFVFIAGFKRGSENVRDIVRVAKCELLEQCHPLAHGFRITFTLELGPKVLVRRTLYSQAGASCELAKANTKCDEQSSGVTLVLY